MFFLDQLMQKLNDLLNKIFILVIFATDVYLCSRIDIELQNNATNVIICKYYIHDNETVANISVWKRETKETNRNRFLQIVDFYDNHAHVHTSLRNRTDVYYNDTQSFIAVKYREIKCEDEAEYTCMMNYVKDVVKTIVSEPLNLTVRVEPRRPFPLKLLPNKTTFKENEEVTFTCNGNVGKPAGWFWWFLLHDGIEYNVTEQASLGLPFLSGGRYGCTFERHSTLTLAMRLSRKAITVRCKVYNPNLVSEDALIGCTDLCVQSEKLTVPYFLQDTHVPNGSIDSTVDQTTKYTALATALKEKSKVTVILICTVVVLTSIIIASGVFFFIYKRQITEEGHRRKPQKTDIEKQETLMPMVPKAAEQSTLKIKRPERN